MSLIEKIGLRWIAVILAGIEIGIFLAVVLAVGGAILFGIEAAWNHWQKAKRKRILQKKRRKENVHAAD